MKTIQILFMNLLFINFGFSQTQSIKGKIFDTDTKTPLIGATIIVANSDPVIGSITDTSGFFLIESVPVGRTSLIVSYVGYKEKVIGDILLNSGKEKIIDIDLEESVTDLDEVVVRGLRKDKSLNDMATISARQFTIEETGRYAGSRNDVSRMASNYAGVTNGDDSRNDIIIRGNSPNGLLWRLNGLTIPDPNHFSGMGSNGGPVSMLNYNVLSNSDFMTSAFPAEFGNALSGVFDIKMRPGNYEKREYMFQFGALGTEVMAEGPFSKKSHGSYLLNYRFSTTSILTAMGIDFGYEGKADYQDLAFNIQLPSKNGNQLNIFGMWGKSIYKVLAEDKDDESFDVSLVDNSDNHYITSLTALGASYFFRINTNTYIKTIAGISTQSETGKVDSVSTVNGNKIPYFENNNRSQTLSLTSFVQHRLNAKNKLRAGITINQIFYDINSKEYDYDVNEMLPQRSSDGNSTLLQSYLQWKYIPFDELQVISGVYVQNLLLNNTFSVEPRLGINWDFAQRQSLKLGFGMHSQTQPLEVYFLDTYVGDEVFQTNKNLDFTKSNHIVAGYSVGLFRSVNLKAELYYQHLYNVPIDRPEKSSSYSLLNFGNSYDVPDADSLVNNGKGRNYGLELTIEKFFSRGYYYLLTTSLYESKYLASDNKWRNTAFNGNYVINLLAGKEFKLKSNQKIIFDIKITTAGGRRYTPIDEEASINAGEIIEIDEEAFSLQHAPYFRTDIKLTYRINRKKTAHEFFINIDNVFNTKNVFTYAYNFRKEQIQYVYQLGLFPTFQYKIYF